MAWRSARVCYRALGRAAMLGEVPDMATRVGLACRHAGNPVDHEVVAAVVRDQLAHCAVCGAGRG